MIFSKKILKISSGNNISFYDNDDNTISFFSFDSGLKKSLIKFTPLTRCEATKTTYDFNFMKQLDNEFVCFCLNDYFIIKKEVL